MGERHDKMIADYLVAYHDANPANEPPSITYERGWFAFRYRATGGIPTRMRAREMEANMARLLWRIRMAKERTP